MNPAFGHWLDLDTWPRRAQYEFFRAHEQPFFQVCAEVDATATWRWCHQRDTSFFLASWYLCTLAVNQVDSFRYRLRRSGVWVHDRVNIATTVLREDESFAFCHLPAADSFARFELEAARAVGEARRPASAMDDRRERDDLVHGSTLPWVRFTSITHARRASATDSIPKIVFGKVSQDHRGAHLMPVAVDVHHALMDGLHASRLLQRLEVLLAQPQEQLACGPSSAR